METRQRDGFTELQTRRQIIKELRRGPSASTTKRVTMKWTICNVLAIVLFCVVESGVQQSQSARGTETSASKEQVLARWADALGGRENLQNASTIHLRGSIKTGGFEGHIRAL